MNKVTVSHSLLIDRAAEEVWDYTQNWNKRSEWDFSVKSAEYVSEGPQAKVVVRGKGGLSFKVTYKMSDRPRLTTLVMSDSNSWCLKGGGGSWKYESRNGSTLWTQNNTLVLKDGVIGKILRPVFSMILNQTTRNIMKRAKRKLEEKS
jgi:hypothetical protein